MAKSKSRKSKRKGRSRRPQKQSNRTTYILIGAVVVIAIVAVALLAILDNGSASTQAAPAEDEYLTKYMGPEDAPVVVIEYSDFQCPYCQAFAQGAGEQLREEYVANGDVRFVYRHFAFLGPESFSAALASECAEAQGRFWDYHDKLFEQQAAENSGAFDDGQLKRYAGELGLDQEAFDTCLDSKQFENIVEAEIEEAQRRRINSTPSVLVNGQLITGASNFDILRGAIDAALQAQ
jgi:protein-disulfide isomerase